MIQGSTTHRLHRMLNPRSIAVVGASEREGSAGHGMLAGLLNAGYRGSLFPVNPRYREVQGLPCHASLRELPGPVDLAVLGVNSSRLEQQLDDAIAIGAGGAAIFDTCYLDGESERGLLNRLKARARSADFPVCGGNGMGFINLVEGIPVTIFDASDKLRDGGNICFITHSGTVFSEIGHNDFRYACNLIVSCGQEINGTMADYMDYALDLESTRVIALFIEEARDPQGFMAALARARDRDVPVVAMKVGRTPLASQFARVHSDADTGNDTAYQAAFDRYGVLRVGSMDEMANLLALLSHERPVASGGLGVVLDSGGEREMFTDLAEETGVALASLANRTAARIRPHLHHALEPANPLDAWGTAANYEDDFEAYFRAMADDPNIAMVVFCGDFLWNPTVEHGYAKALVATRGHTQKPVGALINTPMSGLMTSGRAMTEHGIVVLCGTREALRAIRHALSWRDRISAGTPPAVAPERIAAIRRLVESGEDTGAVLDAFGVGHADGDAAMPTVLMTVDRQFGPLVGLRCGISGEESWCLPGIDAAGAARMVGRLRRGPEDHRRRLAGFLAEFSVIAPALADLVHSIELGPVLPGDDGIVARGFACRRVDT